MSASAWPTVCAVVVSWDAMPSMLSSTSFDVLTLMSMPRVRSASSAGLTSSPRSTSMPSAASTSATVLPKVRVELPSPSTVRSTGVLRPTNAPVPATSAVMTTAWPTICAVRTRDRGLRAATAGASAVTGAVAEAVAG
jgi:hypothetical protein